MNAGGLGSYNGGNNLNVYSNSGAASNPSQPVGIPEASINAIQNNNDYMLSM